jgi:hypothetical protein
LYPVGLQFITEQEEDGEKERGIRLQSPVYSFMFALKSSEAKRQYPKRLKMLFDFLGLSGFLEEQASEFLEKATSPITPSAHHP